jgi:hypothetical protein
MTGVSRLVMNVVLATSACEMDNNNASEGEGVTAQRRRGYEKNEVVERRCRSCGGLANCSRTNTGAVMNDARLWRLWSTIDAITSLGAQLVALKEI